MMVEPDREPRLRLAPAGDVNEADTFRPGCLGILTRGAPAVRSVQDELFRSVEIGLAACSAPVAVENAVIVPTPIDLLDEMIVRKKLERRTADNAADGALAFDDLAVHPGVRIVLVLECGRDAPMLLPRVRAELVLADAGDRG
jgi:hypothetical protein